MNLRRIFQSEFLRNALTLASGSTLAQSISIITAPILYRIYSQEDYGTLGLFMAILGVSGTLSTLQYLQPILLEKDDTNAKTILWLNRVINFLFTGIVFTIVFFFNRQIAQALNNPGIAIWLFLLPISVFFSGQNQIYRIWANRKKKYKLLSFNSILTAILVPLISISVGLYRAGPLGLFLGLAVSHIVPPLVLGIRLRKDDDLGLKYFDIKSMKYFSKVHSHYPIYALPAEFINRLGQKLPVFMLSILAGPAIVGIYNLTTRMLGVPAQLIASSIGSVFRQQASLHFNETGNCIKDFIKTFKLLSVLSIIPLIIVIAIGPDLFALVFGEKWRLAGEFARILSVAYTADFIVGPLSFMYFIANKIREDFLIQIPMILSIFIGLYIGLNQSVILGLILYSIIRSGFYLLILFRSYSFAKLNVK